VSGEFLTKQTPAKEEEGEKKRTEKKEDKRKRNRRENSLCHDSHFLCVLCFGVFCGVCFVT